MFLLTTKEGEILGKKTNESFTRELKCFAQDTDVYNKTKTRTHTKKRLAFLS